MILDNHSGLVKKKDIEDEEYIYKVKVDPRETISMRDSVPIINDKPERITEHERKFKKN